MDILSVLKSNVDESGNISASKFDDVAKAINAAVGKEFVEKKRYNDKLTEIDTLKGEKQNAEDKATSAEKWKTKYDALKDDFEAYKKDISTKESEAAKNNAYKALLKEAGISEKRLETVLKAESLNLPSSPISKPLIFGFSAFNTVSSLFSEIPASFKSAL